MSHAKPAGHMRVWRPRRACPSRNCQQASIAATLDVGVSEDWVGSPPSQQEGSGLALRTWGGTGGVKAVEWWGKLALKARGCSSLVAHQHVHGPQHHPPVFGSILCVLWRKGLSFSLGLRKVCRCPPGKICHLVHLGSESAPIHPNLSCSLSLRLVGQMFCAAGQCGQVQKV